MSMDLMIKKIIDMNSPVVAGLDPKLDYVPEFLQKECFDEFGKNALGASQALLKFNMALIDELCEVVAWAHKNVYSTMYVCWGAFAGMHYKYGIDKQALQKKLSGIYLHKTLHPSHPLVRGFDEQFYAPHSRYSGVSSEEIKRCSQLILLADSEEAGAYLAASKDGRSIFVFGHSEYDAETLKLEYLRDVDKGLCPDIPVNYFVNDDVRNTPINTWRSHAHLLFANWLHYFVYQSTPYNLEEIL